MADPDPDDLPETSQSPEVDVSTEELAEQEEAASEAADGDDD